MVSQLGRSFSWSSSRGHSSRGDVEVAVSVRGGRTRIAGQESLGPLAGAVFGGIGGGGGGGGKGAVVGELAAAAAVHPAPHALGITPCVCHATLVGRRCRHTVS